MSGGNLQAKTGRALWQALDELVEDTNFRERLLSSFPALRDEESGILRRDLLKFLGASMALAGLDGCERVPDEKAFPQVDPGTTPGVAGNFATAVELDGVAQPVIGKTRDGRPIKLEGNPDHPASQGATDAFTQAALLGLYDPARSAAPRHAGRITDWQAYDQMIAAEGARLDVSHGAGFRLLTGPIGSPTLLRQIAAILKRWPSARWHIFDPLPRSRRQQLKLDQCEALVCFDADPLGPGPLQTYNARGWSTRRSAFREGKGAAALFVAEPSPTLTGVAATDRLIAAHDRVAVLLTALAAELGIDVGAVSLQPKEKLWLARASSALLRHRSQGLVLVGDHREPSLQAIADAINSRLGNDRNRLPIPEAIPAPAPFEDLLRDLLDGSVDTVFILSANPLYSAPADLPVAAALRKARLRIHCGLLHDETARQCHWHAALAHDLESWSDGRAADGGAVISQPLVRPWLDLRGRHALLAPFAGGAASDHDQVQETWREAWGGNDDQRWRSALVSGLVAEPSNTQADTSAPTAPVAAVSAPQRQGLDVLFRPDSGIWDGSFATNPWLQELPKPLTKISWGNAVHIAPALARQRGLANGDMVRVSAGGRSIEGPVWILPGQEKGTILVHLGFGRSADVVGKIGAGIGFDAYPLRTSQSPWIARGASIEKIGGNELPVTTQLHFTMAGDDFVRFVDEPRDKLPNEAAHRSFYPPLPKSDPSWGMSIDLDACIGCNACVTACFAENNIPMVGKDQVANRRQMHWLRIDRYYEGSPDEPQHMFQPVPCMHCEDAPCEMGCPVNATVHSPDGLNLQIYNRCIGTRTCSAYCPYKVRRFNWFDFTHNDPPELKAARNPDVTVRGRGVMEKCTYCIQRIAETRIEAEKEGRSIGGNEVQTACQQACPTKAISFGNLAKPDSDVTKRKASPREYDLLPEAQTRPRTTYSARIRKGDIA